MLGVGETLDRPAAALRRARDDVRRGGASSATRPARSAASTRRSPIRRLRRVLQPRRPRSRVVTPSGSRRRSAARSAARDRSRPTARPSASCSRTSPAATRARRADPRGRRRRALRQRLPRRRGRPHARRARDGRRRGPDADPPARHGRRLPTPPSIDRLDGLARRELPSLGSARACSLVGNTPLVELPRISPKPAVRLYAKLEGQNPSGSIKDRVAKAMIETAEASGELQPGGSCSSRRAATPGISLALVAKLKGYPLTCVMPENATEERRRLLRLYGAEIVDSPGDEGSNGAVRARARAGARATRATSCRSSTANEANPRAHYEGTGRRDRGGARPRRRARRRASAPAAR